MNTNSIKTRKYRDTSHIIPSDQSRNMGSVPIFSDLHLYLENLELRQFFEKPRNIPTLGRSQDICWIESIKEVLCEPKEKGSVRGTLVPFPTNGATGLILLLPDWFDNRVTGYTRSIGKLGRYQAVKYDSPTERIKLRNLFAVKGQDFCIYLHDFN